MLVLAVLALRLVYDSWCHEIPQYTGITVFPEMIYYRWAFLNTAQPCAVSVTYRYCCRRTAGDGPHVPWWSAAESGGTPRHWSVLVRWTLQKQQLEMWANAQRDGRPAEYRWRPLFNAATFGRCSLLDCHAVTMPRHEGRWNLEGCPKLVNRSQPPIGRSSLYCEDMWRRYCCLTSFFPIVDTCLRCEDIARQVVRWCTDGNFLRPVFPASRV